MDKSEYFVGNDGQIYWGGCFASLLYPIVSVGEMAMFGLRFDIETYGGFFKSDDPTYMININ